MTREELIKKVALKMDEISSSDDIIIAVDSSDNNPLYAQIDDLLNESINDVLTKAPIPRLKDFISDELDSGKHIKSILETYNPRVVFQIPVPDKFLRLVSITHKDFKRPIVDLAVEGDDISKRQSNKFLRAKEAKPVGVIGRDENGNRVINCFSVADGDNIPNPVFLYIERYSDTSLSSNVSDDDYLLDIVTWACAGKVFAAQGDVNKGQLCDNNATALMV